MRTSLDTPRKWNAYQKSGQPKKAQAALDRISNDIDVASSYAYWQRLKVYKGLADPAPLLDLSKPGTEWNGLDITSGTASRTGTASKGMPKPLR